MATHEELQKIHLLLDEFQTNYRGIAVIQSVLSVLKQALPERRKVSASRSQMEANKEAYEQLIGILPYSLWPSML